MNAPKRSGPRPPPAGIGEGLVGHLAEAGAELLSRADEVALATEYARHREQVRELALTSLVAAQRFLQITYTPNEDFALYPSYWDKEVSYAALCKARHELLLLHDYRLALLGLKKRRGRRAASLEDALAAYGRATRKAFEDIGISDRFVEEIAIQHRELAKVMAPKQGRLPLERTPARRFAGEEFDLDTQAVLQSHRALTTAARSRDRVKNRFAEANLRLVIWIARGYMGRGMAMTDLVQEGTLGLLAALDKFDPTRGFRFSTYATWWIRQAIQRGLANRQRTIRLPVHIHELRRQVGKADRQLSHQLGRDPSLDELANAHGTSRRRLENMRLAFRSVQSLSTPLQGAEGPLAATLGDVLEDSTQMSPEETLWKNECTALVERLLSTLSPRERHILARRYGLNPDAERDTLNTVAAELKLTRERIRQIEMSALKKLKKHARLMGIDDPLGFA